MNPYFDDPLEIESTITNEVMHKLNTIYDVSDHNQINIANA